jgi:hypothetical protein
VTYDDGLIACSDDELVIRRYGGLLRTKRIAYDRLRGVTTIRLGKMRGKWRIWGSGDFRHWYNLDVHRPGKEVGLVLDLGARLQPVITPDDPDRVLAILREHGVSVGDALTPTTP